MNIVIFGSSGFVGTNLSLFLAKQGHSLLCIDKELPQKAWLDYWQNTEAPMATYTHDIRHAIPQRLLVGAEVVFNCAAQTSHTLSISDALEDVSVNCVGTIRVLEAVRRHAPEATLVYPSTTSVAGGTEGILTDIYSVNKASAEFYHRIYLAQHDIKSLVVRLPNLYGPYGKDDPNYGFINYFIFRAMRGEPLTVYGKGQQKRMVMHVSDACRCLWNASQWLPSIGDFYTPTGLYVETVLGIAREIADVWKTTIEIVDWPHHRAAIEIGDPCVTGTTTNLLGDTTALNLRNGLKLTKEILCG